jgi:hypothetical protein
LRAPPIGHLQGIPFPQFKERHIYHVSLGIGNSTKATNVSQQERETFIFVYHIIGHRQYEEVDAGEEEEEAVS